MKPPTEIETMAAENPVAGIDQTKGDFQYKVDYAFDAGTGLNEETVRYISSVKKEAPWILEFRLAALKKFSAMPMPTHWATKDLENIDFLKIRYYLSQGQKPKRTWDEVPDDIKKTFERLGIPEQERKFLAGVEAQFDSEAAYSNIKEIVAKQGVIFCNSTEGLREHPEIFRKFFGKVIPTGDNKFSALNSAVFSGGSFIYVPDRHLALGIGAAGQGVNRKPQQFRPGSGQDRNSLIDGVNGAVSIFGPLNRPSINHHPHAGHGKNRRAADNMKIIQ